jgi:hypothetical protein
MQEIPKWLRPVGVTIATLVAGLLLAGVVAVIYRAVRPPERGEQARMHWDTKNTTRFDGASPGEVAALVSQAVYPATEPANTPDVVILYAPGDWQGGLRAASLIRPLNAVLLPAGPETEAEIARLQPRGSELLGGATVVTLEGTPAPAGAEMLPLTAADVLGLLERAAAPPRHAIIVDQDDPATALLAAPWAAYTGDLVVFDLAEVPGDLPRYALGDVAAAGATRIGGGDPAATAVAFASYDDPQNPLFGWGMNTESTTGYRAYTLAHPDDPATALLSANLARRGKVGPLLWSGQDQLPQVINNYLNSQRAAFFMVPNEGPFHHVWVLGGTSAISFVAQGEADYALEIGPYRMKGPGLSGMDMLAAIWVALGLASALWIAVHESKFLPDQMWIMRLAWPLLALTMGPFGILLYVLAYRRPVIEHDGMRMWDRPPWLQGMVATASSVGFGGTLMVATGFVITLFGAPLFPLQGPLFWLGAPMVLIMLANYVLAVLVAWPLYQAPMLAIFHGRPYSQALWRALPIVLISMSSVSLAMFPGMWWLMMWNLPMMPKEESILWFGVMFFTVFMGFLISWPFNVLLVRRRQKGGLM